MLLSSLSLTGFLLPPDSGEKVTLGLTVLLAFSVFMLLVAENMPPTSEYIPLIGIYLTVIMAMSALSVALSVFVLNCHHRGTNMRRPPKVVRKLAVVFAKAFCMRIMHINRANMNNNNSRQHYSEELFQPQSSKNSHFQRMNTHATTMSHLVQAPGTSFRQEQAGVRVSSTHSDCNYSTEGNSLGQPVTNKKPRESKRSLMEAQILHYLKAVLEAYDKSHGERTAVLEWQEVARVLDKFFFWVFVVITTLTTIFLLLLSPITKHVQFPNE
ncbi:neuronal acetylcholine receptor subunit alpha-10 [Biomphalaria glabrata]